MFTGTVDATPIAEYYTPDGVYYSSHSIADKTISVRVTHGSRNLLTN